MVSSSLYSTTGCSNRAACAGARGSDNHVSTCSSVVGCGKDMRVLESASNKADWREGIVE